MKFQVGDKVRLIKEAKELPISYYDAKKLVEELIEHHLSGIITGIWAEKVYRISFPSGLLLLPEDALEKIEEEKPAQAKETSAPEEG